LILVCDRPPHEKQNTENRESITLESSGLRAHSVRPALLIPTRKKHFEQKVAKTAKKDAYAKGIHRHDSPYVADCLSSETASLRDLCELLFKSFQGIPRATRFLPSCFP
jgi:hypothetical protein